MKALKWIIKLRDYAEKKGDTFYKEALEQIKDLYESDMKSLENRDNQEEG